MPLLHAAFIHPVGEILVHLSLDMIQRADDLLQIILTDSHVFDLLQNAPIEVGKTLSSLLSRTPDDLLGILPLPMLTQRALGFIAKLHDLLAQFGQTGRDIRQELIVRVGKTNGQMIQSFGQDVAREAFGVRTGSRQYCVPRFQFRPCFLFHDVCVILSAATPIDHHEDEIGWTACRTTLRQGIQSGLGFPVPVWAGTCRATNEET